MRQFCKVHINKINAKLNISSLEVNLQVYLQYENYYKVMIQTKKYLKFTTVTLESL